MGLPIRSLASATTTISATPTPRSISSQPVEGEEGKESYFAAFIRACCSCCRSEATHYPDRPVTPVSQVYLVRPLPSAHRP